MEMDVLFGGAVYWAGDGPVMPLSTLRFAEAVSVQFGVQGLTNVGVVPWELRAEFRASKWINKTIRKRWEPVIEHLGAVASSYVGVSNNLNSPTAVRTPSTVDLQVGWNDRVSCLTWMWRESCDRVGGTEIWRRTAELAIDCVTSLSVESAGGFVHARRVSGERPLGTAEWPFCERVPYSSSSTRAPMDDPYAEPTAQWRKSLLPGSGRSMYCGEPFHLYWCNLYQRGGRAFETIVKLYHQHADSAACVREIDGHSDWIMATITEKPEDAFLPTAAALQRCDQIRLAMLRQGLVHPGI